MSEDRLIEWLRTRACTDNPDDVLLAELAQECRDICLHNPNGFEVDAKTNIVTFDVKIKIDVVAALERFGAIIREIQMIDGVREVQFVEIPPALIESFLKAAS